MKEEIRKKELALKEQEQLLKEKDEALQQQVHERETLAQLAKSQEEVTNFVSSLFTPHSHY